MNVLHLNRFSYSGQTTHVFSLVREQQRQGINSLLIMDGFPSQQAFSMYKDTLDDLNGVIIRPGDTAALVRYLRGKKIDLIHAHSSLTYPLAESLAQQMNISYVATCHGLGLNKEEYRPFLRNARAVICISPRVANTMQGITQKVYIIPNGVDLTEFQPAVKEEPVKIALVARMDHVKQKGYNQFCKAVDLLEDVDFYVASNKKPVSKTARYLGWTNEVAALLSQTDIVAGTGRTIIEGLAAGNAAMVLGQTYQGVLTPEKVAKQRFLDISGLSGMDPCYRNIFYDLANLLQNKLYLKKLQGFGRELAATEFNITAQVARIIEIYKTVFR
ncbi:glycosyltransferase family 4 protein [Dethiobacter alkaliphilus]|uniref:glycosyltransferase family 4 protein n=1 Tax=Dethiobacter alkaliphilus TaxID=427926 RepID=UPI0022265C93|nr:glycosyltransferase family 4 protein [Dethiobacter alkaliphilus]MCW3489266.1 glycosyltransferase family 4 protein [Dethiobacter alkaliphilus]